MHHSPISFSVLAYCFQAAMASCSGDCLKAERAAGLAVFSLDEIRSQYPVDDKNRAVDAS
jgi:hypothetical protein